MNHRTKFVLVRLQCFYSLGDKTMSRYAAQNWLFYQIFFRSNRIDGLHNHFTFFLLDLWIYLCQKLGSGSYLLNDSIQCCLDWFPRCVFTIFWKCWITFDRIDSGITNWLVKLFRCETMIGTCVCNRRENHESIYIYMYAVE